MPDCWIALGGNVGRVEETFHRALEMLHAAAGVELRAVSRFHSTRPIGPADAPPYLNAAAQLHSSHPPLSLLDLLQSIEDQLGRVRLQRWGPRTLDLDLLLYNGEMITHPRLIVPHPHLWYRRFVLDPLSEIAADIVHPVKGLPIRQLRTRLLSRPLDIAFAGGTGRLQADLRAIVQQEFPAVRCRPWGSVESEGAEASAPPTLLLWLGAPPESPTGFDEGLPPLLEFSALPVVPRLDLARLAAEGSGFADELRGVLRAALGE